MSCADRGFAHEALSRKRRPRAGPAAFKQRDTKCSLEDLDAAADGGLRQVQNIGSSPKAALFGDNARILQLAKIKRKVWHCARDRPIKPGRQGAGSSRTIFDRALPWPPPMGAIRFFMANATGQCKERKRGG